MNIFVLDYDPTLAARYQCDKHVVKMSLETAQILTAAFEPGVAPYRRTHFNHPCTVWSRESVENYNWLIEHGLALCDEFTFRYGKIHKSREVILWCEKKKAKLNFETTGKTKFQLCFDEKYRIGNAVESYREYYKNEKRAFATWDKGRKAPRWF
ncbi:MAG: hypothetical protein KC493_14180 [Bacteriovoracaceae bacterium]|nr:hypothetical protein [Bacteriovoracaceae bacterium]